MHTMHRPKLQTIHGALAASALGLFALAACGQATDTPDAHASFEGRLAQAVSFARAHPGAFDTFADGRHDADDIEAGRIEAPNDGAQITAELLPLIDAAESYSEAILLARVAGQRVGDVPYVPATLSEDPKDPNWEFAGRNVTFPYALQNALDARRALRDGMLDEMSDDEFAAFEVVEVAAHLERRELMAKALGWTFDSREDLYVADSPDGTIWRKKLPEGYVRAQIDAEPSSLPFDPASPPEDLLAPGQGLNYALIGSDNRGLRSRDNGYSMGSAAWEPKGAIVDDGRTTQEVPVEVDCTGVKIRPRLVATAGHCMFKDGSWNDNTKWIPGADGIDAAENGRDPSPNGYKTRYARVVRGNWFDHEWSNYDFGVFVLYDNSSSCSLHWHGWRKTSMSGKYIYLYGYAGERRDCAASPRANGWCNGSIYGMGGSVLNVTSYRVRYSIDTQPGQSGTGFYEIDGGDRYVLGVHRGAYSSTRNDGTYITSGNRDLIVDAKADYPPNACN